MIKSIYFFILCYCLLPFKGMAFEVDEPLAVLKKGIVGREFVFGKWGPETSGETHLTYLGELRISSGNRYKVLISYWIWGLSRRATNRILIYDDHNHYLGNYKIDLLDQLPFKLEKGKLRFKNSRECPNLAAYTVDMSKGIPPVIFIKCDQNSGNEYLFEENEK